MKRRARQFVLFLIISAVKNWRLSAEEIFAQKKKLFCCIWKNQGGSDYFQTKINSWAKFKRNVFFDPKRTGPLLGRLRQILPHCDFFYQWNSLVVWSRPNCGLIPCKTTCISSRISESRWVTTNHGALFELLSFSLVQCIFTHSRSLYIYIFSKALLEV